MSGHEDATHETHYGPAQYVKIWALLMLLFVVSVLGPELGIRIVTLLTAFGIAFWKAYIVAAHFMHLKVEKKFVSYILLTMVLLIGLMWIGVASDIMKTEGKRWQNTSALEIIEQNKSLEHPAPH